MITYIHNSNYSRYAGELSRLISFLTSTGQSVKKRSGKVGILAASIFLSPFISLIVWRLTYLTNKLVKQVKDHHRQLPSLLLNPQFTYDNAVALRKNLEGLVAAAEPIAYLMKKKVPFYLTRIINNMRAFQNEAAAMIASLNVAGTYSQKDLGLTDAEFAQYNAQFKSFEDIWDYPSSKEDEQLVFDHKKQRH